jgi:hypothetical protein
MESHGVIHPKKEKKRKMLQKYKLRVGNWSNK